MLGEAARCREFVVAVLAGISSDYVDSRVDVGRQMGTRTAKILRSWRLGISANLKRSKLLLTSSRGEMLTRWRTTF